jgi:hypothetical protein
MLKGMPAIDEQRSGKLREIPRADELLRGSSFVEEPVLGNQ